MAQQPDFNLLAEGFQTAVDQIALLANLPAIDDRLTADNRHRELMTSMQNINTRLDAADNRHQDLVTSIQNINTRLDAADNRHQDLVASIQNMNARIDQRLDG